MTAPDLLNPSPDGLGTYYRLPFGDDPVWHLGNGNYDDGGHGGDLVHHPEQAYSYDFGAPEGTTVRAARGGQVVAVESDHWRTSWAGGASPEVLIGQDDAGVYGNGNIVVIRHLDGTYGCYNHLLSERVFVRVGDYVPRGRVLALSGCTGNVTGAHLHFDVHPTFKNAHDWSGNNTIKIWFEDQKHESWRPKPGDAFFSNNSVTDSLFYGLFEAGTDQRSFVAGLTEEEILTVVDDAGSSKLPLSVQSFEVADAAGGAPPQFSCVVGAGPRRTLKTGMTRAAFERLLTVPVADRTRQVVVDFATYLERGRLTYAALLEPGQGRQIFSADLSAKSFAALVKDAGAGPDPKHVSAFEMRVTSAGRRYSAILSRGKVDQVLFPELNRESFIAVWKAQAALGRDITAFVEYAIVDDQWFTMLVGPRGAGGQQLIGPIPYDALAQRVTDAPKFGSRVVAVRARGQFLV